MSTFIVHFDDEPEPDTSWMDDHLVDPADYITLVAWVTTSCTCCGQQRTVASLGNISVTADTYIGGDTWSEEEVSGIGDLYLRTVAQDLLEEARSA